MLPGSHSQLPGSKKLVVHHTLVLSFGNYDGISYDEYIELTSNPSLHIIVAYLLRNKSFPLDYLLDSFLLKHHEEKPFYWVLERYVKEAKISRKEEIITHCRSLISGSESMSNEMVLSVAGVSI